jgi:hypothetical protein
MADSKVVIETEDIKFKIEMVLRQTDYSKDEAREKLFHHNFDEIKVIKEYLGIIPINNSRSSISSINQEIYKQIRSHLNKPNESDKYLSYS